MKLSIPELCLVVLVGPSGCGKSTFARKHFKATEVLSSDFFRGLVSDDENSQEATPDAFEAMKFVAAKRLAAGKLTVIDATNVQPESRKPLIELAREHDVLAAAVVLKVPEDVCHQRNRARTDRDFGPHVIRNQAAQMRRGLRGLEREGFRYVHVLESEAEVEGAEFERQRLWNNRKEDRGPFDIIGDVHGCYEELVELLTKLGYSVMGETVVPPVGRKVVFLGDLVDRGPRVPDVLRLVMGMVGRGDALCVPGNHDVKLVRKLRGRDVKVSHGLAETLAQLEGEPREFVAKAEKFLDTLVGHYVLDGGRLVVAHAGMKERYVGRASARVREFALYGETTGETDEFGLPVRHDWAAEYRGQASVVYGHTPVPEAEWLNRTMNVDTGCVFGGKLTALRWPEREVVSVAARRVYAEPARPFLVKAGEDGGLSAQQVVDDVLDIEDVVGKRIVSTRLSHAITVREENAIAALEVMNRFAANPKWLIYLPPTMSPSETTREEGLLEHPREAFEYFAKQGVGRVVCEEKHMGSRAVVVVCRDAGVARRRFGIVNGETGVVYTRTGRRFFEDPAVERELLGRVRVAIGGAGWWERFESDWFCLDCELMPWSAKAQDLLKNQYAAVGAAARAALPDVVAAVVRARGRGGQVNGEVLDGLLERGVGRLEMAGRYVEAYRRYCWPVSTVGDLKLAPFHVLASEGRVYVDKDHVWHMETVGELAGAGGVGSPLTATSFKVIDVTDAGGVEEGIRWWEELTGRGGEGMVVKPFDFIVRGRRGLVQPAVKCRGKEYLRIIYGPEYTAAENLGRLRARGLAGKRSLALREFALGVEALERFVRREPLRRVHECVFGVLAMESEPVDPRL